MMQKLSIWLLAQDNNYYKLLQFNSISFGNSKIQTATSARNLGLMIDPHLDMSTRVSKICKVSYFKIRSIWKICTFSQQTLQKL